MKYRRLNLEELKELEREFVLFLASQGVSNDLWDKYKKDKDPQVDRLLDDFSDFVFEKILTDVNYLELKKPKEMQLFKCEPDKIHLRAIVISGESAIDFTQNQSPEDMTRLLMLSGASLKLYQAEREYRKGRNLEIFELMQQGALISKDGALYQTLDSLRSR